MICDSCGITMSYALIDGKNRVCEECFVKIKPPMLILAKHWANNALFDPEKRSYVGKGIDFFEGYGFKIFNHRIFSNSVLSPVFR